LDCVGRNVERTTGLDPRVVGATTLAGAASAAALSQRVDANRFLVPTAPGQLLTIAEVAAVHVGAFARMASGGLLSLEGATYVGRAVQTGGPYAAVSAVGAGLGVGLGSAWNCR